MPPLAASSSAASIAGPSTSLCITLQAKNSICLLHKPKATLVIHVPPRVPPAQIVCCSLLPIATRQVPGNVVRLVTRVVR